jgi:hypothetical protein
VDFKVECYSGYEYAERPVAFTWEGRTHPIEAIEGEWRIAGGKRFRVRTREGQAFDLFYEELCDEWRIQPLL